MSGAQQPRHALQKAQAIKSARAEWKRELKALGRIEASKDVAKVLRTHARGLESDALELIRNVAVVDVIDWIPRRSDTWARTTARRLGLLRIADTVGIPVKRLTAHEALALADALTPTTVTNKEA